MFVKTQTFPVPPPPPEPPAATATAEAVVEAPGDAPNFADWTNQTNGNGSPEGAAVAPAKEPEAPAEPQKVETVDESETPEEEKAVEDKTAEPETPAEKEPEAPVIEFAPDEPFETFTEKVDKYFDAYELPKEIVAMKEGFAKQIEALQAQVTNNVEVNDAVKATVEAATSFDEFRKDDATGKFVPKTNEFITYVQANKPPHVFKQFVFDAMNAPSEKYKHLGFSMLHEMYVDAGVPPQKMDEFIKYVSGESAPPPAYPNLPAGVPQEIGEAFMQNAALRKLIEDSAETLAWTKEEQQEYPEQFAEAKQNFDGAIAALAASQKAINDGRAAKEAEKQQAQHQAAQFQNTVLSGVQNIQKAELVNFGTDLSEKLSTFIPEPAARSLQVLSYQNLIVNALADDVYGEMARAELKSQGIPIEFAKAQTLFQQIQDAVAQKEVIFQQTGDEKAAAKAVEKSLTNALRELGVMRKNIIGKVAQVVTKSYTTSKPVPADKVKPSIRPTLKGGKETQVSSIPKIDYLNPQDAGKAYFDVFSGALNQ